MSSEGFLRDEASPPRSAKGRDTTVAARLAAQWIALQRPGASALASAARTFAPRGVPRQVAPRPSTILPRASGSAWRRHLVRSRRSIHISLNVLKIWRQRTV